MKQYRARLTPGQDRAFEEITRQPHAFETLASDYDMPEMDIYGANSTADGRPLLQTVEEEFNAYKTSPLSGRDTKILSFWEVRLLPTFNTYSVIMQHRCFSCQSQSIRQYLLSLWITYLFKPLLSPASVFSPLVQKPILKSETELITC